MVILNVIFHCVKFLTKILLSFIRSTCFELILVTDLLQVTFVIYHKQG